ncbi:MAG: ABC transporter permease [Rubrivivax sp.]|jgi:NitT/TauT family transport system permease protein|nr:ABC transporter permease [Rubrivivax sp.]
MQVNWGFVLKQLVAVAAFLVLWELATRRGWIDVAFFGQPSGIFAYLWDGFAGGGKLWVDLGYTVAGTLISFVIGSGLALMLGLLFVMFPRVEHALEPHLMMLNAMPRIALAPLFLLWFGLGLGSKIAVGVSLAFFIVLANTVAGIRGVSQDAITLSRSLGARPLQVFFKVTLPSAVPVIFSGLRLALIYSMLGVIGAELIAAERGLGQTLAYLQSTFNMNGVMGLLVLLAVLGMIVTQGMTWLERSLLRWQ